MFIWVYFQYDVMQFTISLQFVIIAGATILFFIFDPRRGRVQSVFNHRHALPVSGRGTDGDAPLPALGARTRVEEPRFSLFLLRTMAVALLAASLAFITLPRPPPLGGLLGA